MNTNTLNIANIINKSDAQNISVTYGGTNMIEFLNLIIEVKNILGDLFDVKISKQSILHISDPRESNNTNTTVDESLKETLYLEYMINARKKYKLIHNTVENHQIELFKQLMICTKFEDMIFVKNIKKNFNLNNLFVFTYDVDVKDTRLKITLVETIYVEFIGSKNVTNITIQNMYVQHTKEETFKKIINLKMKHCPIKNIYENENLLIVQGYDYQ